MGRNAVRVLGGISIGAGVIFYAIGYATVRPLLIEIGILTLVPALGGATTVIGLLVVLALTWLVFVRLFTVLDIDKM